MPSIVYALISYVGWGTGDIFGTVAARRMGSYPATLWGMILGLLFSSAYLPFALEDFRKITAPILLVNTILGIVLIIGLVAFNEGLQKSNPTIVGSVAATFPVVTLALSMLFFHERLTGYETCCVSLILAGLFLTTIDFTRLVFDRDFRLPLTAMLAWGIYFAFVKKLVAEIGWFWPNYISLASFPVLLVFVRIRNNVAVSFPNLDSLKYLIPEVFLVRTAEFSYNLAVSKGLSSIISPIAGSYVTLFVILTFIIFREPIRTAQVCGILLSVIGIVGLALN